MTGPQSRGDRSGYGLLCAALLVGPMALAACGSMAAPGSQAAGSQAAGSQAAGSPAGAVAAGAPGQAGPADLALCAAPAAASRVVIARSPMLDRIQPEHVELSAQTTVTDAALVRALARVLCALPVRPAGIVSCPALFEGTYTLQFTAAGRRLPAVSIQQSGCEIVTGLGRPRTVSKSPGFWPVLAKTAAAGVTASLRPVYLPQGPTGTACTPVSTRSVGGVAHCPGQATPGGASAPMH